MKLSTRLFAAFPLLLSALAIVPAASAADGESWYYACKPYETKECVKYGSRDSETPVRACLEERSKVSGYYWTYIGKQPGRGADEIYPVSWSELSSRANGNWYAYSKSRDCDANTSSSERLRYITSNSGSSGVSRVERFY